MMATMGTSARGVMDRRKLPPGTPPGSERGRRRAFAAHGAAVGRKFATTNARTRKLVTTGSSAAVGGAGRVDAIRSRLVRRLVMATSNETREPSP